MDLSPSADDFLAAAAVAVLIPALDEEESLPAVLESLPREWVGQVVVVDNGSRDRTAEVARAFGATVIREDRRGYGSACLAGLRHLGSLPRPPEIVVFMDADRSDDGEALPRLVKPVLRGEADLVLGVRWGAAGGPPRSVPVHARVGNHVVLGLVRALFGLRFLDLPPFRAVRFQRLLELDMDDESWGWTLQMQVRAGVRGLRIKETAVPHRARVAGRSKISGSLIGSSRAGAKMVYTIFRERARRR
jgi:glycosyltransferase involved in cell wall biosynthesis